MVDLDWTHNSFCCRPQGRSVRRVTHTALMETGFCLISMLHILHLNNIHADICLDENATNQSACQHCTQLERPVRPLNFLSWKWINFVLSSQLLPCWMEKLECWHEQNRAKCHCGMTRNTTRVSATQRERKKSTNLENVLTLHDHLTIIYPQICDSTMPRTFICSRWPCTSVTVETLLTLTLYTAWAYCNQCHTTARMIKDQLYS